MGKMPLFRNCKLDELIELAHGARQVHTPRGGAIVQTGKPAAGLGLLLRGTASLMVENVASGSRKRLEKLKPGALFGEVGLLLGSVNPHSVVAEEDCDSLLIRPDQFNKTMMDNPEVSLSLARKISSRLVQATFLGAAGDQAEAPAPAPAPEEPRPAPTAPEGVIPWVETSSYSLTDEVVGMIPPKLIKKHRMLPLRVDDQVLTLGMVNPRSVEAKQELRRLLQAVDTDVAAISEEDFNSAVARLKLVGGAGKPRARAGAVAGQIAYAVDVDKEAHKKKAIIGNEVIKLFDQILLDALDMGASDIHIEPGSVGVKVRYRTEGSLVERKEVVAPTYAGPLIGRIKVLAELNITERHKPQDGRIVAQLGSQDLNLRVTTMAVARGEKAVIRIIDPSDVMRPLRQIFIDPRLEEAVHESLAQPYGAVVVAGPTGSGKSSTLYSMLNERRASRPDTSIVTVEDPVEFLLPDVTQVSVLPRFGFGFATALYGLMRQDPDVIMIGELRDGGHHGGGRPHRAPGAHLDPRQQRGRGDPAPAAPGHGSDPAVPGAGGHRGAAPVQAALPQLRAGGGHLIGADEKPRPARHRPGGHFPAAAAGGVRWMQQHRISWPHRGAGGLARGRPHPQGPEQRGGAGGAFGHRTGAEAVHLVRAVCGVPHGAPHHLAERRAAHRHGLTGGSGESWIGLLSR